MPDLSRDLLGSPLLRVEVGAGVEELLTLPGVLAALGAKRDLEFVGLRPHQEHAWHAFLVQIAALSLHHSGDSRTARSESEWRTLLLALAGNQVEPWCLCVSDLSKPAFLQAPVPEGSLKDFGPPAEAADAIDTVITARNHDVKMHRLYHPDPDHWVYALVSLQTMEGYSGRSNYGIVRMNGGYGSRPAFHLAADDRWATKFGRDVEVWLEQRQALVETFGYREAGGVGLVWLEPWDGLESLSLQTCDPCFIEICRRLRIVPFAHGGLAVRVAPTQTARIDPHRDKDLATGDVWTPRKVDSGAALTVTDRLTYDLLRKVMFDGGYHPAATQVWRAVDGRTPSFVAKVLARGKSKTAGYHHRTLPIPPGGTRFFSRPEERERIAKLAEAMVKTAEVARNRVLRPALLYLLQGAPDKLNREDKRAAPWCERLEDLIDFSFFEYLFAGAEKMEGQALDDWKQALRDWAESVLRHAVGAAPVSATRRIKAIAVADNVFRALAHRHLAATAGDAATNRPPEVDHERSA